MVRICRRLRYQIILLTSVDASANNSGTPGLASLCSCSAYQGRFLHCRPCLPPLRVLMANLRCRSCSTAPQILENENVDLSTISSKFLKYSTLARVLLDAFRRLTCTLAFRLARKDDKHECDRIEDLSKKVGESHRCCSTR